MKVVQKNWTLDPNVIFTELHRDMQYLNTLDASLKS